MTDGRDIRFHLNFHRCMSLFQAICFCGTIDLDWSNVAHSSFLIQQKSARDDDPGSCRVGGVFMLSAIPEEPGSMSRFGVGLSLRYHFGRLAHAMPACEHQQRADSEKRQRAGFGNGFDCAVE